MRELGFPEIGLPLVLGIGAVILAMSFVRSRRSKRHWQTRPRVVGTIVERRNNPRYDVSFDVLVAFRTQEGRDVRGWASNVIGIESSPTEGSSVEVAYDPDAPERFQARPTTAPRPTSPWLWVLVVVIVLWVGFFLWASWT